MNEQRPTEQLRAHGVPYVNVRFSAGKSIYQGTVYFEGQHNQHDSMKEGIRFLITCCSNIKKERQMISQTGKLYRDLLFSNWPQCSNLIVVINRKRNSNELVCSFSGRWTHISEIKWTKNVNRENYKHKWIKGSHYNLLFHMSVKKDGRVHLLESKSLSCLKRAQLQQSKEWHVFLCP